MAVHNPARTSGVASVDDVTSPSGVIDRRHLDDPAYQAFLVLWLGFTVAPLLFGLDKFFDSMVPWTRYLSTEFADLSPFDAEGTMRLVGAIEIVAGLVVLLRPRIGGYLVAAWLGGIIVNLLFLGDALDIALRDVGLLLGALALARLATRYRPQLLR
jgi:hypothetical protein